MNEIGASGASLCSKKKKKIVTVSVSNYVQRMQLAE
jgi:hypothetical protein